MTSISPEADDPLLRSACDLLRHDWVKSFLFPDDRAIYARQLHHALSQQTAITASVHFGTQSSSVGPCQSLPGLTKKLSLLCVPSFSTGSITVGFEIAECLADSSPRPLGIPKYIGRYVRDDDQGIMFIIAEHPQLGVTQVTCCSILSPGCRSQVYAVMSLRKLREVVSNIHKHGYDPSAIRRATIFAYSSIDMRVCPKCGCNRVALCECALNTKRKAHPMDHEAELQNLSSFTGDFGGLAKVKVIHDGHDSVATFASRVEAVFTSNRENRRNLSAWAMTNVFETETLRLSNYRMPGSTLLIEDASQDTIAPEHTSSTRALSGAHKDKRKRHPTKDTPVRRRVRRTSEASVISNSSLGQKSSALSDAFFTTANFTDEHVSSCRQAQESFTSATEARLGDAFATDGSNISQPVQGPSSSCIPPLPTLLQGLSHQKESTKPGKSYISPESNLVQSLSSSQPQLLTQQQVLPVMQPMQQVPGIVLLPVRQVYQPLHAQSVQLAPALTPMPVKRVYRDTRTKDDIRRARNRASAQRSNEKKKREVAKLKDDLEASLEKKKALVERERVLRRENAALRAALGDTGVAV